MSEIIRFIIVCALTAVGLFVLISGVVGVFRFKYALTRIHAAAVFDTAGIMLVLLGVMVATGLNITTLKMLFVVIFLWLSSPVSSHLIGRLEITINDHLERVMIVADEETVRHEKEGD